MARRGLRLAPGESVGTIPVVSFVGRSNSGKTTLLEEVIGELTARGYRVAAVKHTHHDFQMDLPGKDSWRLAQAGSQAVVISSPTKMALIERPEEEFSLAEIAARIGVGVDIILAEGYKHSGVAKIQVVADPSSDDVLPDSGDILLTVSPEYAADGRPRFDRAGVADIVDTLVERIAGRAVK